jgi:APA family basic amino acid/polyamine antiporter
MTGLSRVIGVRPLALTMVNLTVGAGIFGLPAFAARELGAAAIFGYLLCCALVALVGLCFAEVGSRVTNAGGVYAYAQAAFGPVTGAITGHLLWFANGALSNAAVAVLMMSALGLLVPWLAAPLPRALFLVGYYAFVAAINVRGTRQGANLSQLMTAIKLAPLVALVILGLPHVHWDNLRIASLPAPRALGHTTVLLFFAFMGFESGLNVSGELEAPARTVPRAILLAVTLIAAVYVGLQVVAQGILGPALALAGDAPLDATARAAFGSAGGMLILVATILSTAGLVAGDGLSTPRVMHALGRDGILPSMLGRVDATHATPAVAICTYAVICAALALSGTFRVLAAVSAAAVLLIYLICCVGLFRLRARNVRGERPPFLVPGGPLVPLLAILTVIFVLSSLGRSDFLLLGALLVAFGVSAMVLRPRTD